MPSKKYTAVKVSGLDHWVWFETQKIQFNNRVIGKEGWGKGGSFTEIDVDANQVEGRITSETLQY